MGIDIEAGVLSYIISNKEKEISFSESSPPQQVKVYLLEEFDFKILETTPTKAFLKKVMRQKRVNKKMNALADMLAKFGSHKTSGVINNENHVL